MWSAASASGRTRRSQPRRRAAQGDEPAITPVPNPTLSPRRQAPALFQNSRIGPLVCGGSRAGGGEGALCLGGKARRGPALRARRRRRAEGEKEARQRWRCLKTEEEAPPMDTSRGVACLLVAVICLSCAAAAAARSPAARLHRHLKRLNKPAVKSIEVRQPTCFLRLFVPRRCACVPCRQFCCYSW